MQSNKNLIYTLVGGFLSKSYKLVSWEYKNSTIVAPTPSLALFKYLKEKNYDVKLKILIPISIFDFESLKEKNFSKLKSVFKADFENFYLKKLINLLQNFNSNKHQKMDVKNLRRYYDELKNFVSFFEEIDWKGLDEEFNVLVENEADLPDFYKSLKRTLNDSEICQKVKEENKRWKRILANNVIYEIIPSFGVFKKSNEKVIKCEGQFQDRVLYFYTLFGSDFLNKLQSNESVNFYLDISVGLNSLVIELTESFYNSVVFWEFYFLGKNKNNKGKFYLLLAEPITGIPQKNDTKYFSLEKIKKLAFFSKPLKWKDINSKDFKDLKKVFKQLTEQNLNEISEQSILLFNSIEKGVILGLTLKEKLIKAEKLLEYLSRFFKIRKNIWNEKRNIKLSSNLIEISINADRYKHNKIRNLTYLIMLGLNLTESVEELFKGKLFEEKNFSLMVKYKDKSLPIEQVLENLEKLFKNYNLELNAIFLSKEWNGKRICSLNKKASDREKFLAEGKDTYVDNYEITNKFNETCRINNIKEYLKKDKTRRNFLAHMGTEDCITVFYKKNNTLFLKYKDNYQEAIKEFILNDFQL